MSGVDEGAGTGASRGRAGNLQHRVNCDGWAEGLHPYIAFHYWCVVVSKCE